MQNHFEYIYRNHFSELIECLITFLKWNESESTSLKAFSKLKEILTTLAQKEIDNEAYICWKPILCGFVEGIEYQKIHIRMNILDYFFQYIYLFKLMKEF